MDNPVLVIGFAVIAVIIVVIVVFAIRRHRYVQSLRDEGWEFDTSPTIDNIVGLNHAPFGTGFGREVDDMVYGTTPNGLEFKALEYDIDGWGSKHYVLMIRLPKSLPFLYVRPADRPSRIPGLPHGPVARLGTHEVLAATEDYAHHVGGVIVGMLGPLAGFEVSVDHANLVIHDIAEQVDDLRTAVHVGGEIAAAVAVAAEPYDAPPAPPHLSFTHRPHWRYVPRDDSFLNQVRYTRGGQNHEARDIVLGEAHGIAFIRLTHKWETESRDSDGDITTEEHTEELCEYRLLFPFRALNLGSSMFGFRNDRAGLQFESSQFNEAYKVTALSPRFAHDVLHPRMMEWLLQVGRPQFQIFDNGAVVLQPRRHWSLQDIEQGNALLYDFFARVPDFVYQNLGAWPRPVPEHEW
ncbi:hypothetical protein [uncultured Tessaracoccus sp.]|uniref:hypothetical protein n=1 Tax=uncultured Tessaracoccus sp. TaxID=905023 RepID=UPI0025D51844|nr:hypothetical protein [uncultured Tessaracoccus sp.]